MTLKPKSAEILDIVKEQPEGVLLATICEIVGRTPQSVSANVTDLQKKGLVIRRKEMLEDDTMVTYVEPTEDGLNYTAPVEEA